MCGDIMNTWNVKYVRATLNRLIGIVSAVLMSAEQKLESKQLKNISKQISIKKHYNDGINHLQGQRLKNDTGINLSQKHWLLSVLKGIKNTTQIDARRGIENMDTDAETITQDTLTEKQSSRSLMGLVISVLSVKVNQLKSTTSSRYQKAAQTILITYSHYANPVTQRKATDESYL